MAKILVVDDEENIRKVLKGLLARNGYNDVLMAGDGLQAIETINDENIDLIISDVNMPNMDGLELFEEIGDTGIPFIILTAYGTIETAVNAVKNGVYDFLEKPFDEKNLIEVVNRALKERTGSGIKFSAGGLDELFFSSTNPAMEKIKENLGRVINTRAGILITGETGTGKGMLAGIIHSLSPEKDKPFIKINCAAIPANLMESELFGYARGAFTGVATDRPGKFELADGGTLLLDEIGEMSPELQAKILCVLQEKEVTRLGEGNPRKIDVRVVAATNINLKEAVAQKKFREDLYFRLNIIEFALPPVRDREDDIQGLVEYFAGKYAKEFGTKRKNFDIDSMEKMRQYPWPGNVRELENVVQKVTIMEKEDTITAAMLDNYLKNTLYAAAGATMFDTGKEEKCRKEAALIRDALNKTGNNKTKAAELLGVSRRTLLYRIKEYGI
ncbi:MAG: sigma-54 dependent transcriptional regulator [Spirochaetia bacterium]|nr:sigma-54 dependent transcriptional regulator [Spirochaetia bacterium]